MAKVPYPSRAEEQLETSIMTRAFPGENILS